MADQQPQYPPEWDAALGMSGLATAVAVGVENFVAALSDAEFDALVKRTRH